MIHESLTATLGTPRDDQTRLLQRMESFPRIVRHWLLLYVVVHAIVASESRQALSFAFLAWSVVALFRVPQKRLLLEQSALVGLAFFVVACRWTGPIVGIGLVTIAYVVSERIAPEAEMQRFVGFDLCHVLLTSRVRASTTHHFLELAAPLERGPLTRALGDLLRDVPRLRSFVREAPLGIARFVAPAPWVGQGVLIEWHDSVVDPRDTDWFDRPIDLTSSPPIRLFHARTASGGALFGLTLHHSVADGTGAMLLLDGLLRRYDRTRGRPAAAEPIASDGPLCRRLALRESALGVARMLALAALHSTRGKTSATLVDDATPRDARFELRVVDLAPSLWEAVVSVASRARCTPNHLLLAASLRAADAVRRERGLADDTFRVVVPSDLRKIFDLPRSLPNYIGTVPLDVSPSEVRSPELVAHVMGTLRAGRTVAAQMVFPIQIGLLGLLPPAVGRRVLHGFDEDPKTSAFSVLFSHIRVPRELHIPADVELVRLWCASSPGRQLPFGVAVTTVLGRTWALLQYLSPYVAHEAVASFEGAFVRELERMTASAPDEMPCASA
jgi:hypothetical protein